ncbi:MAG: tetratricopeptide repeat protein [Candidatus Riflebacteria bacterium]|nr:tetratricopeptide repeat protein [Candidatus Riflebacteria bacterium]
MLEKPRNLPLLLQELKEKVGEFPNDLSLLYKIGRFQARNNDWKEAATAYKKILEIDSRQTPALIELGVALSRLGKTEEARFQLERAMEVSPNSPGVFLAFAAWFEATGNVEQQIVFLQRAATLCPEKPEIRIKIAEIFIKFHDNKRAIEQYEALVQVNPNLEAARFSLGVLFMKEGRSEDAATQFQKVIEKNPSSRDAYLNLALCLYREGKYFAAIPYFVFALKGMKKHFKGRMLLAKCYEKINDWDRALVILEKLAEEVDTDQEINQSLAEIYEKSNEIDSAAEMWGKIRKAFPQRADYFLKHARLLFLLGKHQATEDCLKEMFLRHPGNIEGHELLGDVLFSSGRYIDSLNEYRKTVMSNENYLNGWTGIARAYRILKEKSEEYKAIHKILILNPGDPEFLFRSAQLEKELKLPTSLERFRQVVNLCPGTKYAQEAEYYIRHAGKNCLS